MYLVVSEADKANLLSWLGVLPVREIHLFFYLRVNLKASASPTDSRVPKWG